MKSNQTLATLTNSTRNFREKTIKTAQSVELTNIKASPVVGTKTLAISSDCKGSRGEYHQMINLYGVNFSKAEAGQMKEPILNKDGNYIFMELPNKEQVKCSVHCGCDSYDWDYKRANQAVGANNSGKVPGKVKNHVKTTNRPPRNPENIPGMCKHLVKLADDLEKGGVLV